jgi:hypothetical protein
MFNKLLFAAILTLAVTGVGHAQVCTVDSDCALGDACYYPPPLFGTFYSYCVHLQTDPNNCGWIGHKCTTDEICTGGECVCQWDFPNNCQGEQLPPVSGWRPFQLHSLPLEKWHSWISRRNNLDSAATTQRTDAVDLARQIREKAARLEKMSANAADAVDYATPKPTGVDGLKAQPAPESNRLNDTLRAALRILRHVEENLNEVHARLGNPFAENPAKLEVG